MKDLNLGNGFQNGVGEIQKNVPGLHGSCCSQKYILIFTFRDCYCLSPLFRLQDLFQLSKRGVIGFRIDRIGLKKRRAQIMDFCGKSSGLADFENTVNHGSAVIFDADSGLCQSYVPWVLKEIWIIDLSSALVGMLISSSNFISKEVHLNSGVRLLLELYCAIVKECCLLHYLGEINRVAFTCTSFILNLYTSVFGCGYGFG